MMHWARQNKQRWDAAIKAASLNWTTQPGAERRNEIAMAKHTDNAVENDGSLFLLQPLTETASDSLHNHVAVGVQWFVNALVVETQ